MKISGMELLPKPRTWPQLQSQCFHTHKSRATIGAALYERGFVTNGSLMLRHHGKCKRIEKIFSEGSAKLGASQIEMAFAAWTDELRMSRITLVCIEPVKLGLAYLDFPPQNVTAERLEKVLVPLVAVRVGSTAFKPVKTKCGFVDRVIVYNAQYLADFLHGIPDGCSLEWTRARTTGNGSALLAFDAQRVLHGAVASFVL